MTTKHLEVPQLSKSFKDHIDSFISFLHASGYASQSAAHKQSILIAFTRWSQSERIGVEDLGENHLVAFVKRRPPGPYACIELRALRQFLTHVRIQCGLSLRDESKPPSPIDDVMQRYLVYLRRDRGLAKNSILVYTPLVRDFLHYRLTQTGSLSLETLPAETIQAFLMERTAHRSSQWIRLLTIAMRSFFRFLFLHGETPRDFSMAVPMFRTYRQSEVPVVLSPQEVERVLSTTDRSTIRGRRDYAILLLLARLGLRAGEIVSLHLSDIHWRTGEILVHGKGSRLDHVPLLADVGEAIALYIHRDRGTPISRRIFLRLIPPHIGLAGPASINHIVRLALDRADISPQCGHVSHLFRHSLATRMIRCGASIAEIAEVLRHRSQSTTAIYAKVSFDELRTVARPWPIIGGAQ